MVEGFMPSSFAVVRDGSYRADLKATVVPTIVWISGLRKDRTGFEHAIVLLFMQSASQNEVAQFLFELPQENDEFVYNFVAQFVCSTL